MPLAVFHVKLGLRARWVIQEGTEGQEKVARQRAQIATGMHGAEQHDSADDGQARVGETGSRADGREHDADGDNGTTLRADGNRVGGDTAVL